LIKAEGGKTPRGIIFQKHPTRSVEIPDASVAVDNEDENFQQTC